jgi:hypothetical protein
VTLIEGRLGQRNGLYPRIVAEIRAAQDYYERQPELPWFLLTKEEIIASTALVDFPTGFLRETNEDTGLWVRVNDVLLPLGKDNYSTLARSEDLRGTGIPQFYYTGTIGYELFPEPDQPYSLDAVFFKKDNPLDDDLSTNLWLTYAPELIVSRAGFQMARYLRAPDLAQIFMADLAEATKSLYYGGVARDMGGRSLVMGG